MDSVSLAPTYVVTVADDWLEVVDADDELEEVEAEAELKEDDPTVADAVAVLVTKPLLISSCVTARVPVQVLVPPGAIVVLELAHVIPLTLLSVTLKVGESVTLPPLVSV